MYRIDRAANRIQPLTRVSFKELGFKERTHLQEWLAREPVALGEELLIVQKEFSGFSDTNERLDLLALDKQGSLVIIENKLDDTGRDVTWQALKYASYCSTLSKEDIRSIFQDYLNVHEAGKSAKDVLAAFFDDEDYDDLTTLSRFWRPIPRLESRSAAVCARFASSVRAAARAAGIGRSMCSGAGTCRCFW